MNRAIYAPAIGALMGIAALLGYAAAQPEPQPAPAPCVEAQRTAAALAGQTERVEHHLTEYWAATTQDVADTQHTAWINAREAAQWTANALVDQQQQCYEAQQ